MALKSGAGVPVAAPWAGDGVLPLGVKTPAGVSWTGPCEEATVNLEIGET